MHRRILESLAVAALIVMTWSAPLAQAQAVGFNLPAQPLADSLRAVASQTETNLLFDPPLVAGRRAPALKAQLTVEQALQRLLAGTGIRFEHLNEKTIVLSTASAVPSTQRPDAASELNRAGDPATPEVAAQAAPTPSAYSSPGAGPAPASRQDEPLEEILVTATKRVESLSKVPISISAYNRESLEASGVKSVGDLAALTPGVEFDNSSGFGPGTLTNIAIRGINSSIGTSTTGIYIDDTPVQSRITGLSYFGNPLPLMFDVERVEVDRGPQGTLFGAGAEGGALRFVSPEPGLGRYSGFTRAELASTQDGGISYEAGAAGGGPLIANQLGFRASAWYRRDGGYVNHVNPINGDTVDSDSNWTGSYAVHGALAGAVSEQVKVTASIYAQSVHNNDSAAFFAYLSDPDNGTFRNGRLLRQPNTDRLFLPSLKVDVDLGFASLTSVTSYLNRRGELLDDNTSFTAATFGGLLTYGSPLGPEYPTSYAQAVPTTLVTTLNQISEEMRLASNDPGARLRWTLGLYYSTTRQFDGESVSAPYIMESFFGLPADTPFLDTSLTSSDKQYAAFGQIDYRIIDKLTLTAGLRIARTDAGFTEAQDGVIASPEFPVARGDEKETPVTPKVGLAYQIDDDNMVYVSAGKGYRVGGGNLPIPLASPTNPVGCPLTQQPGSYQSDSLWSYEIGVKDRLFGGRLRLDTSAFHTDWSNIQQQIFFPVCGFGYTANTGKARVNGFDVGLEAAPLDGLTLGVSVAYTDAYFTKDVFANGALVTRSGDVVGNPPGVASPWSTTTSARYELALAGGAHIYVRAEDIFHSHNNGPFSSFDPEATGFAPEIPANPSTNVLNLRTGLAWSEIDVSIFVNNALNAHPLLTRYQDTPPSTLFTNLTLRPRTVGLTASYRF